MSKVTPIDDDHTIVRKISKSRIVLDQLTGEYVPLPSAFELRTSINEDYLSASWLEFFGSMFEQSMTETVRMLRKCTNIRDGDRCGFAVGQVTAIKETCRSFNRNIRIVHEKGHPNPAYAAVRQIGPNDGDLMEELAKGPWRKLHMNAEFPES